MPGRDRVQPPPEWVVEELPLGPQAVVPGRTDVPGDQQQVARRDVRQVPVQVCCPVPCCCN